MFGTSSGVEKPILSKMNDGLDVTIDQWFLKSKAQRKYIKGNGRSVQCCVKWFQQHIWSHEVISLRKHTAKWKFKIPIRIESDPIKLKRDRMRRNGEKVLRIHPWYDVPTSMGGLEFDLINYIFLKNI